MSDLWLLKGLKTGIVTEDLKSIAPFHQKHIAYAVASECPVNCISDGYVDMKKCIQCGICTNSDKTVLDNEDLFRIESKFDKKIKKSIFIFVVDGGSCNACNMEIHNMINPVYDLSRFGISFTNNPKHADLLLITGVITGQLDPAIKIAYESMPEPKKVVRIGVCSISGGIFDKGIDGISENCIVAGCPPDPVTILKAILSLCGMV
ncbi:MAG: NADH:ubiquinone oxidoreductase [Candidatus Thermoplasmatota archaeon]|jgi:Ni,Fe-hydrogenase III small subunit|nr:NADH:ubiquinone oxidoreductase [Candidatus Thermoplasmatota archaeon]MCL5962757.1 NADH:ubiquinone oxidoreductase [Candidatus Thermoplasmatota archaeon]